MSSKTTHPVPQTDWTPALVKKARGAPPSVVAVLCSATLLGCLLLNVTAFYPPEKQGSTLFMQAGMRG
jgi:hypothetical protein